MTLQPALSPGPEPSQRQPLTFAATLASWRSQIRRENSVALRCCWRREAAQCAAALGMHCRSSETGATDCASPALSSHAPWPNRRQRSGREEKGWQELLSRDDTATKQRYAGDPAFSACDGAASGLLAGGRRISAPSRARYDSRPSLTGLPVNTALRIAGLHRRVLDLCLALIW
ncbi:hypothetical protein OPT61_g9750 [Boeremia exigua]|uniref:Uncharacterized protein n=1 Tax=Boeremia exigua TaxID=749465 RepID=A0ACC2HT31_9PLEO|nr:hypothetical protein OPT61_g9750 [Boeremia exigua]